MPQFEIHFTPQEANALLPTLRSLFGELHRLLQPTRHQHGSGSFEFEGPTIPDSPDPDVRSREAQRIFRAIIERGIVVQDVGRGLIDFPCVLPDGREVFLCWELRDGDRIGFFHDLDAGFAGRTPLELE